MHVDHHEVVATATVGEGIPDPSRGEDLRVERRGREHDDIQAVLVLGGELAEGPWLQPFLDVLVPGVDDRADLFQSERRGHVSGDGVGVEQQHPLAAVDLQCGGQVERDGRLAHATLGIEHGDDRRPLGPGMRVQAMVGFDDRADPMVDRLGANEHRLDSPAQRVCRIRPGEVLVVERCAHSVGGEALKGSR